MKKKRKVKSLKKEADMWCSRFVRARDKGQCYTCPYKNNPKKLQNGHFIPRQFLATRYDERNCHAQCYACNMFYGGQPDIYALNLIRDYGENIIKELNASRYKIIKDIDYEKIAKTYKAKFEELCTPL